MRITIMVGISGSGKTTKAREIVKETGASYISRDVLRERYYPNGGTKRVLMEFQERYITLLELRAISKAFEMKKDLVIDDTNLRPKDIKAFRNVCYKLASNKIVPIDFYLEIMEDSHNLDLCIERNNKRPKIEQVPDYVIVSQYHRFKANYRNFCALKVAPFEGATLDNKTKIIRSTGFEVKPYMRRTDKPKCYLCDIDGTVAKAVNRDIYSYSGVITDRPIQTVIDTIERLSETTEIVFVSGRDEICREETEQWLEKYVHLRHGKPKLFMRPHQNSEHDDIIKYDIFNRYIRDNYNVMGWFDDRHRVSLLITELGVQLFFVGDLDDDF